MKNFEAANRNYVPTAHKSSGNKIARRYTRNAQDPFWYAANEEAIKDMASLPWNDIVGAPLLEVSGEPVIGDAVPGFFKVGYKPTLGSFRPDENYTTINNAASAFYNQFTQGFSTKVDFQASDLLMAAVAGGNLFSLMLLIKRAYGVMKMYKTLNPYFGKHFVNALGFDFDSFSGDLADFRAEYNILVDKINKVVKVPRNFTLCDRWDFLNTFVFADNTELEFSTLQFFAPKAALQYDPVSMSTGTCLKWVSIPGFTGTPATVQQFFDFIHTLIRALDDDDVREMYGALVRVYGEDSFKKLSYIDESYETPIVKNDIISASLHNMSFYPEVQGASLIGNPKIANVIRQTEKDNIVAFQDEDGVIMSTILIKANMTRDYGKYIQGTLQNSQLIDMYDHMVSPANVLDITATVAPITAYVYRTEEKNTDNRCFWIRCRSEVYSDCVLYKLESGNLKAMTVMPFYMVEETEDTTSMHDKAEVIAAITHVDAHPIIKLSAGTPEGSIRTKYFLGEIDRYCLVDNHRVGKMNDRAMWKMLLLPNSTKSVT